MPSSSAPRATWNGEWWKIGGGGTVWDSMAYDPELDLLYVGTGNGSPWTQALRSPGGGDNLYLSSILALRPDDGDATSGTTRPRPATTGTTPRCSTIMLADLEIGRRAAQGADAGAEERLLLRARRATGELCLGREVRAGDLGGVGRSRDRAAGRDRRRAYTTTRRRGVPASRRGPQLASDGVQSANRLGVFFSE